MPSRQIRNPDLIRAANQEHMTEVSASLCEFRLSAGLPSEPPGGGGQLHHNQMSHRVAEAIGYRRAAPRKLTVRPLQAMSSLLRDPKSFGDYDGCLSTFPAIHDLRPGPRRP